MVEQDMFERIKQRHGGYASWAVWAKPSGTPTSHIGDMHVLSPEENRTLLQSLRNDVIMVGLNISRPVLEPFRNFHDDRPQGKDFKIRYAFMGHPYWGAYMTDIIKGVEMPNSNTLMDYLRANPQVVQANLETFLVELSDLRANRPTILAFGVRAYGLLAKNLPRDKRSDLIKLPHYSDYGSQEKYKAEVLATLGNVS